jgi:two-component system OmpR family response regulator
VTRSGRGARCYTQSSRRVEVARVFLIDDEEDVVNLLTTVFSTRGFEVESETDAQVALSRVLASPPDLLVLDLMMPDLDGFELLRLLRQHPAGATMKVMIVSARTEIADQLHSLQLGADAYVCKPFSPADLLRQVEDVMGAARGGAGA